MVGFVCGPGPCGYLSACVLDWFLSFVFGFFLSGEVSGLWDKTARQIVYTTFVFFRKYWNNNIINNLKPIYPILWLE